MKEHYIAQLNIAKAKSSMDSNTMQGFVERLDEINILAEQSHGFIWRLQTEEGDATLIRVFNDPLLIVNMSVWESIKSLQNYVYQSSHVQLIQGRKNWFDKTNRIQQVLWWVPEGYIPTVQEGKNKLSFLEKNGPSINAFTFANPFQ